LLAMNALHALLAKYEDALTAHGGPHPPKNRAGQLVGFHAGEQVHCGMGYDGTVNRLDPDGGSRIMFFTFWWPQKFLKIKKHLVKIPARQLRIWIYG